MTVGGQPLGVAARSAAARRQRLAAIRNGTALPTATSAVSEAVTPAITNVAASGTTTAPAPSPWRNSKAKKMLYDDIVSKRTLKFQGGKPQAVYHSRKEFERYKEKIFKTNYYNLRKAVKLAKDGADASAKAYSNDRPIMVSRRPDFHYDGSNFQKRLRKDVQQGLTDGKKPSQVRASRTAVYNVPGMSAAKFASHLWFERNRHQRKLHYDDYRERMRVVNARFEAGEDE